MGSRFWAILFLILVGGASCNVRADQPGGDRERSVANIIVNNATELKSALAAAKGGETLILAAGDYGEIAVNGLNFASTITIRSQNLSDMAHLDKLQITNSKNIVVTDLDVGGPLAPGEVANAWYSAVRVSGSSNITLDSLDIHGSADGIATNDRMGMYVVDSSNVKVLDSEFSDLQNGAYFNKSTNILVAGNEVHDIRNDGLNFSQVQGVDVDGNKFYNWWRQAGDHCDAIQFWTTGTTKASTDIQIRNNQIYQGAGSGQQGIFFRDELEVLPYERVTIANNLIYQSGEYNGLSFSGGKDITIVGNSVLSIEEGGLKGFLRVMKVTDGLVESNVSNLYIDQFNTNVTFKNNIDFSKSPGARDDFPGLDDMRQTDTDGLILLNFGYQLSAVTEPVPPPPPPPAPTLPDTENAAPLSNGIASALGQALATQLVFGQAQQQSQEVQRTAILDDYQEDSSNWSALTGASDEGYALDSGVLADSSLMMALAGHFSSQVQYY